MRQAATRLPPISAVLVIEIAQREIERDALGADWCAAKGVGALRKKIGAPAPTHALGRKASEWPIRRAYDGARVVLAELCERCPFAECPMKRWGIVTSEPSDV